MTSLLTMGPGQFLTLYAISLFAAVVAGLIIPRMMRPHGAGFANVDDADSIAWLSGGRLRLIESTVARLMANDQLRIGGNGKLFRSGDGDAPESRRGSGGSLDAALLSAAMLASWREVVRSSRDAISRAEQRFVSRGLAIDNGEARLIGGLAILPYVALMAVGLIRLANGMQLGRPVGFLTVLLIVTFIFALIRFTSIDRRTRGGREALQRAKDRHERLRLAPLREESDMAVALFGTAVLAGSSLMLLHQMRNPPGSSDSSGSSDSGGDSGCGGGGCGGGGCGG